MMKPNIGISEINLKNSASLLSAVLADAMVLYVKTRNAHWNVSGESFMELHKLFEKQYKQLEESIDEIAERIGKMGEKTMATMQEFLALATIKENPGKYPSSKQMLAELLKDHEQIIVQLRENIEASEDKNKDVGTADFLTDLIKEHETMAWVLRRYLN